MKLFLKAHDRDPFLFSWFLGLELAGQALLAPSKQHLSALSPCCWARVAVVRGNPCQAQCSDCATSWICDDEWSPTVMNVRENSLPDFLTCLAHEWETVTAELFLGPLRGEVAAAEFRDQFAAVLAVLTPWTAAFTVEPDRHMYEMDPDHPLNYHEGEILYRKLWARDVNELQGLLDG